MYTSHQQSIAAQKFFKWSKRKGYSSLTQKQDGSNETHDPEHPLNLIPELCRLFYTLGWVTGTGGGISIKKEYLNSN